MSSLQLIHERNISFEIFIHCHSELLLTRQESDYEHGHGCGFEQVLSRNGKAQDLTSDHRPFGRDKKSFLEVKRIQEAGGWVRIRK